MICHEKNRQEIKTNIITLPTFSIQIELSSWFEKPVSFKLNLISLNVYCLWYFLSSCMHQESDNGKIKIEAYSTCNWDPAVHYILAKWHLKSGNWSISYIIEMPPSQFPSNIRTQIPLFNLWAFLNGYETTVVNSLYLTWKVIFIMHVKYFFALKYIKNLKRIMANRVSNVTLSTYFHLYIMAQKSGNTRYTLCIYYL